MEEDDDLPIVELTVVPTIYADGICRVAVVMGNNVRVTYYERRCVDNREVRVPVVDMVRPMASMSEVAVRKWMDKIRAQRRNNDRGDPGLVPD